MRKKHRYDHTEEILEGELDVSGRDTLTVRLYKYPTKIEVNFVDDCSFPVPCNPQQEDIIDAVVISRDGRPCLFLEWSVQSVRKVKWKLYFN